MTSSFSRAGSSPGPAHPVQAAVRAGDYQRAALRLLYGFLVALEETAPDARDELLGLIVERRLAADPAVPADRGRTGRTEGHR